MANRVSISASIDCGRPDSKKAAVSRGFLIPITGAGEGIRTLDPNLGKVVLYP